MYVFFCDTEKGMYIFDFEVMIFKLQNHTKIYTQKMIIITLFAFFARYLLFGSNETKNETHLYSLKLNKSSSQIIAVCMKNIHTTHTSIFASPYV